MFSTNSSFIVSCVPPQHLCYFPHLYFCVSHLNFNVTPNAQHLLCILYWCLHPQYALSNLTIIFLCVSPQLLCHLQCTTSIFINFVYCISHFTSMSPLPSTPPDIIALTNFQIFTIVASIIILPRFLSEMITSCNGVRLYLLQ